MDRPLAEFRGCDNVCVVRITEDSYEHYTVGSIVRFAEVNQIVKTVEQNTETRSYDNKTAIVIHGVGADTVTLIVPAMFLDQLALVTGADYDPNTGAYINRGNKNERVWYALGYRLKLTDGTYRYVWKLKGMFTQTPDEQSTSESANIETSNQTVTYTAMDTIHEFTNGGAARDVMFDERDNKADLTNFFASVATPDNLPPAKASITALTLSASTLSVVDGATGTLTYSITPSGAVPSIQSSNNGVASVEVSGTTITVTGNHVGTAIITATAGTISTSATVTVTEE